MRLKLFLFIFYCILLNFICKVLKFIYRKTIKLIVKFSASSANESRVKRYTIIERNDEQQYNRFFYNNNLRSNDYEGVETERWFNEFNPETDTHFLLFTRQNAFEAQTLLYNDTNSLINSNFDAKHPIR